MAVVVGLLLILFLSTAVLLAVALPNLRRGDRLLTSRGEEKVGAAMSGFKESLQKRPSPPPVELPDELPEELPEPRAADRAADRPADRVTDRPADGGQERRKGSHRSPVFTGTRTVSAARMTLPPAQEIDLTGPQEAAPALGAGAAPSDPLVKWSEKMLGPPSPPFLALDAADDSSEALHRKG